MSSTAPIPPIPPATKTPKKRARSKVTGPSVSDLIVKAVTASKERSGVSLVALKRSLAASGYDVVKNNARVNLAIRRLVSKGGLVQTKGSGASGSFKASKKQVVAKKKPIKKKRPTKAKKPKKGKRPAAKKTGAAKKSTRKPKKKLAAKKAKSPKKAKKPRAKKAKTTKAAKTKATKRKSTRARAAAP